MASYEYRVTLQGNAHKDYTTLLFPLQEILYADALIAAGLIKADLIAVTDAFVKKETLTEVLSEDGTFPAVGVDCHDEAVVTVYLDADGVKKANIRIPAPVAGIFQADGMGVDTSNALLIAYVAELSQQMYLSDGEQINTTQTNGIKSGYKRSRPKILKP